MKFGTPLGREAGKLMDNLAESNKIRQNQAWVYRDSRREVREGEWNDVDFEIINSLWSDLDFFYKSFDSLKNLH